MHFQDEWQSQIGIESLREGSQLSNYQYEWESHQGIGLEDSQVVPQLLEYQGKYEESAQTTGPTPASLASLNCIYDFIITGNRKRLRMEVYYFFNQPYWKLSEILEPEDANQEQCASLAALSRYLVVSFNLAIKGGYLREWHVPETKKEWEELQVLEEEPGWAAKAPKLEQPLAIPGKPGEPGEVLNEGSFLRMIVG